MTQAALDQLPVAALVFNEQASIVSVNPYASELLRLPPAELLNRSLRDLVHPDDHHLLRPTGTVRSSASAQTIRLHGAADIVSVVCTFLCNGGRSHAADAAGRPLDRRDRGASQRRDAVEVCAGKRT
ncbi:PAS domain-containing protein [Ensifer canadensis]